MGSFEEGSTMGMGNWRWVAKGNFKGRTWGTGSAQRQFINRTTPYYDQRPPDHDEPFHRSFSSTMLAKNRDGRGGSLRIVETILAKVYDSSESHYSLGCYISLRKILLVDRRKMINVLATI